MELLDRTHLGPRDSRVEHMDESDRCAFRLSQFRRQANLQHVIRSARAENGNPPYLP